MRIQGAGFRVQGSGFRIQGGEYAWGVREMYGPEAGGVWTAWIRVSELRIYTLGFKVSGLGASRLRFRVPGFGFRFRIYDFGVRFLDLGLVRGKG